MHDGQHSSRRSGTLQNGICRASDHKEQQTEATHIQESSASRQGGTHPDVHGSGSVHSSGIGSGEDSASAGGEADSSADAGRGEQQQQQSAEGPKAGGAGLDSSDDAAESPHDASVDDATTGLDKLDRRALRKFSKDLDRRNEQLTGLRERMRDLQQQLDAIPVKDRIIAALIRDVALPGTLAVVAAFILRLDAFGGFHWDYSDVSRGIIGVAPLCFVYISLLLGDFGEERRASAGNGVLSVSMQGGMVGIMWGPPPEDSSTEAGADAAGAKDSPAAETEDSPAPADAPAADAANEPDRRQQEDGQPLRVSSSADVGSSNGSEAGANGISASATVGSTAGSHASNSDNDSGAGGDGSRRFARTDRPRMSRQPLQPPPQLTPLERISGALDRWQAAQVMTATALPGAWEAPRVLGKAFADEMVLRAVGLTVLAGWCTDRLYEAGADPDASFSLLPMPVLGTPEQAGQALAISIALGYIAGNAASKWLKSQRQLKQLSMRGTERSKPGQRHSKAPELEKVTEARAAVTTVLGHVAAQQGATAALTAALGMARTATLSIVFLSTGNLAASFAAGATLSGVSAACRGVRKGQLLQRRSEQMQSMLDLARQSAKRVWAQRQADKARFATKAASPSASQDEAAAGGTDCRDDSDR